MLEIIQLTLLLHYCVSWDKDTYSTLEKSKKSVLVETCKERVERLFTHYFIYSLIYSFKSLLRGVLLLQGAGREKDMIAKALKKLSLLDRYVHRHRKAE